MQNVSRSSYKAARLREYAITRNEKILLAGTSYSRSRQKYDCIKRGYRDSKSSHDTAAAVIARWDIKMYNTTISVLFGSARNEIEPKCERESSDGMLSHNHHAATSGKYSSVYGIEAREEAT